ncbi:efflux RND transporter periplasmic adaptor subunit [Aliamphritea ceti]|uniref:efflux RND transporter periplasmic adaptor subunit n=1 Tax=Aliamphritea ceti TaxID=1524258 RepID=UPI0021C42D71|nr:efflux RND transporter periplasmic adaptor subunit [Aliamphritea ceti]
MKPMKQYLLACATSLILIPSISQAADEAPQGLPAEVVHATTTQLDDTIEVVGNLTANEAVILRPEQSGIIREVLFEEGSIVEQGQQLIQLDTAIYAAELQQAKARVALSQIAFKRADSLSKKRVGSQQDRDSALAQLRVDQAQQVLAETRLAKMTITAPYPGSIGLRKVSPGDYVNAGEDLVELVDNHTMKVEFRVPEKFFARLKPGQTIKLNSDALRGESFSGEIYAISPTINDRSHNVLVRARVPNPELKLRPGLFAKVQILLDSLDAAVMVPEEAIIPKNNKFFVYKVVDNSIEMVNVEIGQRRGAEVHIASGLAADDVIVTAGQLKLFPGMPVTPIFVDGSQSAKGESE